MVLKERKIYIPKNEVLRVEIIQLHHNILIVRYKRKWKMTKLVTINYWWLEVTRNMYQNMICVRKQDGNTSKEVEVE